MGCKQSTPVIDSNSKCSKKQHEERHAELMGIGRTERQLSKMQRDAMNNVVNESKKDEMAQKSRKKSTTSSQALPKLDESGFLTAEEVAKRTFSSISNKEVTLGTPMNTTHLQFAHWTQRGYYPEDPHKRNQDEFGTHLNFAGVEKDAMFAVYDGHGEEGQGCASFAKERLPKAIAKHVRKTRCQNYQKTRATKKGGWNPENWPMLTETEYELCCRKAFLEVNQAMHVAEDVVDTVSGTTATTVNFHGDFVSICNVGDSRAVLGHRVRCHASKPNEISVHHPGMVQQQSYASPRSCDKESFETYSGEEEKNDIDDEIYQESGAVAAVASPIIVPGRSFDRTHRNVPGTRVLAIPLSKDQTPYRRDERERVKGLGASVMSIDQMQGKEQIHEDWGDLVLGETLDVEGDSPRIWAKGKDYPGCAFTRSLGDSMSECIGVTAAPEILSAQLTQNDEYLVIASDGVFEFLTNQAVVDFCVSSESPLVACEKIVNAAYEQWLFREKRTDDITVIVCFLQNFRAPPNVGGRLMTTEDLVETMSTVYGERPAYMTGPGPLVVSNTCHSLPSLPEETYAAVTGMTPRIEQEIPAYVTQEAQARIITDTASPLLPPPPQMTFDDTDMVDVKFESLLEKAKMDSGTSATSKTTSASIASREDEDDDSFTAAIHPKPTEHLSPFIIEEARNIFQVS